MGFRCVDDPGVSAGPGEPVFPLMEPESRPGSTGGAPRPAGRGDGTKIALPLESAYTRMFPTPTEDSIMRATTMAALLGLAATLTFLADSQPAQAQSADRQRAAARTQTTARAPATARTQARATARTQAAARTQATPRTQATARTQAQATARMQARATARMQAAARTQATPRTQATARMQVVARTRGTAGQTTTGGTATRRALETMRTRAAARDGSAAPTARYPRDLTRDVEGRWSPQESPSPSSRARTLRAVSGTHGEAAARRAAGSQARSRTWTATSGTAFPSREEALQMLRDRARPPERESVVPARDAARSAGLEAARRAVRVGEGEGPHGVVPRGSGAVGPRVAGTATGSHRRGSSWALWIGSGGFGGAFFYGSPWLHPHPFWFDPWFPPHGFWWLGWHRPRPLFWPLGVTPIRWRTAWWLHPRPVWLSAPTVWVVPPRIWHFPSTVVRVSTVAAPLPAPAAEECAEVVFRTAAGTEYELEVELPALGATTVRELALTLERDLALGRSVDLVAADGLEFRLQPEHVEAIGVFPCR